MKKMSYHIHTFVVCRIYTSSQFQRLSHPHVFKNLLLAALTSIPNKLIPRQSRKIEGRGGVQVVGYGMCDTVRQVVPSFELPLIGS